MPVTELNTNAELFTVMLLLSVYCRLIQWSRARRCQGDVCCYGVPSLPNVLDDQEREMYIVHMLWRLLPNQLLIFHRGKSWLDPCGGRGCCKMPFGVFPTAA
jgi:hypothetical protein